MGGGLGGAPDGAVMTPAIRRADRREMVDGILTLIALAAVVMSLSCGGLR